MNNPPKIEQFYQDFDQKIPKENIKIKQECVGNELFNIVHYIYNNNETFNDPDLLEGRGIVFDQDGNIVSRPFEKFFNLNGSQFTLENDLDFTDSEFYLKMDGSLITFVPINGKIYAKTKKSFYSDVAKECQEYFGNNKQLNDLILYNKDLTFLFEYTSPSNRIVIDYGNKPALTLLAIRNIYNGEYLSYQRLIEYKKIYEVNCINIVKKFDKFSLIDAIIETKNESSDIEGFVVVLKSGQRVKMKCEQYLTKHRVLDEFNAKNLSKLIVADCADDLRPTLSPERQEILTTLEKIVQKEFDIYSNVVYNLVKDWEGKSLKEIGMNYNSHPQFNPAIQIFKNLGSPEQIVKKFFLIQRIEHYSTKQLW